MSQLQRNTCLPTSPLATTANSRNGDITALLPLLSGLLCLMPATTTCAANWLLVATSSLQAGRGGRSQWQF